MFGLLATSFTLCFLQLKSLETYMHPDSACSAFNNIHCLKFPTHTCLKNFRNIANYKTSSNINCLKACSALRCFALYCMSSVCLVLHLSLSVSLSLSLSLSLLLSLSLSLSFVFVIAIVIVILIVFVFVFVFCLLSFVFSLSFCLCLCLCLFSLL